MEPMRFNYYVPTRILFGEGVCKDLVKEIRKYGEHPLLLVGIPHNETYDTVIDLLKENRIDFIEMEGVDSNPRVTTCDDGATKCKENNIDSIVALGGGSTIDCAKGIACGAFYDGSCWDLVKDWSKITNALPIISIPTMPAAGSEMDNAAVLTNPETGEKLLIASELLFPKTSFLDPTFVYTLPRRQTAAGTADIFVHTLEEYFDSGNDAYLTDGICEAIFKTCIKYCRKAMDEPTNYEARANLVWAAPLAINGLINCGKRDGWTLHNIQHPLGGFYDVIHGEALAVLVPHWMEMILDESTVDRFVKFGVNVFGIDETQDKFSIANEAIAQMKKWFFEELEIKPTLKELGVRDNSHFKEMAEIAFRERSKQYVDFDIERTIMLYERAL